MYLNCKTYFSFRYGTYPTEELVRAGVEAGAQVLALTNINNTCDAWDFVRFCTEQGIRAIAGVEIRNEDQLMYILLAANNIGFCWINEFLSEHLLEKKPFPLRAGDRPFFAQAGDGFVIYPLRGKPPEELWENERIGVLPSEVHQLRNMDLPGHPGKWIVRQPVSFQDKTHYNLHRLLRAVDKNTLLSKLGPADQASPQEYFLPLDEILLVFRQYPSILTNTYRLADACSVTIDPEKDKNKKNFSATKEDDRILLEKLARDGFLQRYGRRNKKAAERLSKELEIIDTMNFNAYFLINWDIIRYAQSRGFYYVGRGSGANSIVAYCLRITDVDPIELDLYFERFLNPHRTSPPDFDIDFSWRDRDEVIDYIFKRYGRRQVTLLGSYPTFQWDAIIQQLGKVFGQTPEDIKRLQKTHTPEDNDQRLILRYGKLLKDFPNNLSIHPCGMLISEEPIFRYAALFMPPKGFPTAQMDMFVAENIGLNKFDILSQRGLGHIRDSLQLIRDNKGIDVNIHDFANFRKDEAIKRQVREANTIGCFYIESPAMRQLLKKLRCDDYPTLVAASSIIRPGVAQSGMMREYIWRFHNRDKIVYLHPLFEEHMGDTFGVMVFQEDVIKIAHYFAGLDLGEADVLRRAMSGKYRSNNQFQLIRDNFFAGCRRLGHTDELSAEVWRQMESFAGYSFNKAHSASFAVESYMSLYLKTYYPREFMVAVINNFGGFYSRELYFLELLKCGGRINPPCVNTSDEYTNIRGDEVFCGFIHIKGMQQGLIQKVLDERRAGGPYLHLQDFIERTGVGMEQLNTLVSIGAFRFTGKPKKRLLWEANFLQRNHQPGVHAAVPLFHEPPLEFVLPELTDHPLDDLYDEVEILGFALSNPFALVDDDPSLYVSAKDLGSHAGRTTTVLAYFIARKHVTTVKNDQMFFGTFVDADLDWIDTVHFPDSARSYPLHSAGFYKIKGKVVEDFGVFSLEVHMMTRVGYKPRSYSNLE